MLTQLSPQDASFVFLESPTTPMHIGSLAIYDPSTADGGELTEESFTRLFEERMHQNPFGRQKLVRVPLDADYPYWIEDANFDIEYHIRRWALPKPADTEQLYKVAARLFARPLDMTKPLWEVYLIEGLDHVEGVPKGSIAILTKTHHAAVDGTSGMHLVELMHDLTPKPAAATRPAEPWHPDRQPSDMELMVRTAIRNLQQPFRFAEVWAGQAHSAIRKPSSLVGAQGLRGVELPKLQPAPKTRFNRDLSAQRSIGSTTFDLDDLRTVRGVVDGATVNDAVLAICGGGLRRYLESKKELPGSSLVAMAPVSTRSKGDDATSGNQVSAMFVPVGTDISDPVARLLAIRESTSGQKAGSTGVAARAMTDYAQFVPAFTAALASRLQSSLAAQMPSPPFNVSISNVPGPQVPLYAVGARMINSIGYGGIVNGMGLIMPVTSYCGQLTIAFTSCREMLPDPEFFALCLEESFDELCAAAGYKAKARKPSKKGGKGGGKKKSESKG
ncbi:MAG: wax ester/triacylglycerol synthase family O-acyltransferase [Pseudomonadaceae bacterium]|nr:wax ester/triacylglycerol synthase family O-acyltransferase [Pseudomonadaceae bacterium]